MRRLIGMGMGCVLMMAATWAWGEETQADSAPSAGSGQASSPQAKAEGPAKAEAAVEEGAAAKAEPPVMLFPIVKDGKWGYMDETGKVAIEPQYQLAWDFSEGMGTVASNALRGFVDRTGNLVIPFQYGWAGKFSEGLARVDFHKNRFGTHIEWYRATTGRGYVDKTGKAVIRLGYGTPFADFSDGVAVTRGGYIGKDGKPVSCEGEEGSFFSDGLAAVRKGALWGYIDRSMKLVIEPQFAAAREFSQGLAAVAQEGPGEKKQELKWGYIDKSGKIVIPCEFRDADRFSEGLAAVLPELDVRDAGGASAGLLSEAAGKSWGYVNKEGMVPIKPRYDYAWPFSEGLGRVLVGEKQGYVDTSGRMVIEPKYDSAWEFSKGLGRVGVGNREGYIDHGGKYVWEPTE